MHRHALSLSCLLAATAGAEAPAETSPTQTASAESKPVVSVGLKAGGVFPQVLGRLNTNFSVGLEATWVTPLLGSKLALEAEVAYSQPSHDQTLPDPRVPGASYAYTVTERTLAVFVGPKYFILPPGGKLVPWVAAGVRAQFIDSQMVGDATVAFGRHDETGTHLAYGGQAGCGYRMGPGLLALELQLISAPLDHLVTGAVNVGDLAARVAYLFVF